MPYSLKPAELEPVLEAAVLMARDPERKPPNTWLVRLAEIERIELAIGVVVLGTMALARATNPDVDPFTLKLDPAHNRSYNARAVAEFMQAQNQGRFDFGSESKNPFNSTTVFGGQTRLDTLTRLKRADTAQVVELLKDCARDLAKADADQALEVLATFLRVRMAVAKKKAAAQRSALLGGGALTPEALVRTLEQFIVQWTEGGRAGQAFVGALLDCVFNTTNVDVGQINSPRPADVRVKLGLKVKLAAEVKQVTITEGEVLALAATAARLGADTALVAVFARQHKPLDRGSLRSQALRDHNVALCVAESVEEVVAEVATFSTKTLQEITEQLPEKLASRLRQQRASDAAQQAWARAISDRVG